MAQRKPDIAGGRQWWHEAAPGLGFTHAYQMERLHRERSPFQEIEVFEHTLFGRVLVLDGIVQATEADEYIYHEMAVHVPLLGQARARANVLIVGGGDGGILREVLLHDFVESVVMVEIDRKVIEIANDYLGINGDYDDPRVDLVCDDAARFIAESAGCRRRFDVIILDLTEPPGPSSSLFNEGFCEALTACLEADGVCLDSDSIFVTKDRPMFYQEICGEGDNLLRTMQSGKYMAHVQGYRSLVPLFAGGEFGFFLYTKDGRSYAAPVEEHVGRHYNPDLHRAAFALPTWWRTALGL